MRAPHSASIGGCARLLDRTTEGAAHHARPWFTKSKARNATHHCAPRRSPSLDLGHAPDFVAHGDRHSPLGSKRDGESDASRNRVSDAPHSGAPGAERYRWDRLEISSATRTGRCIELDSMRHLIPRCGHCMAAYTAKNRMSDVVTHVHRRLARYLSRYLLQYQWQYLAAGVHTYRVDRPGRYAGENITARAQASMKRGHDG